MQLSDMLRRGRKIRAIGFDDAHHPDKTPGSPVNVAGVVCSRTRFEGMLWGQIQKDGMDSTDRLAQMVTESKFAQQLNVVLLDGLTFGGCNVVDVPLLASRVGVPVITLMRKQPDMTSFRHVVDSLPERDERWRRVQAAGPIHELNGFFFQVSGEEADVIADVLPTLTDQGKVPESLRIAHLIGSAVMLGVSGKRA